MLKFRNSKFSSPWKVFFGHFERILNQRTKNWKYAKYEALFWGLKPLLMGI